MKPGLLRGEELLVGFWGLFFYGFLLVWGCFVLFFFPNKFVNKCFETELLLLKHIKSSL